MLAITVPNYRRSESTNRTETPFSTSGLQTMELWSAKKQYIIEAGPLNYEKIISFMISESGEV